MTSYLTRRIAYAIVTLLGITVATFVLIHAVPGDPVTMYTAKYGLRTLSHEVLQEMRHRHHLDQPLLVQYGWWLRGVLSLDFGPSVMDGVPVIERISRRLPNTILLSGVSMILSAAIGVPVGISGAGRRRRGGSVTSGLFILFYSLPTFWIALLLMQTFSVDHPWLPLYGMTSDDYLQLSSAARVGDRILHMVLPVVTLTVGQMAIFARFARTSVEEVIALDYIAAAKARGVGPGSLLWHHALRNAAVPLITLFGLSVPYLISGSVIVERIFQWDGIGRLYVTSILTRDYPTVLGLTVVTAIITLGAGVGADLLYAAADPRIRLEGSADAS
jgi:peptide/nickel transport system permease protein